MNEFIEQFLIEARELVEQGTADLLAAEQHPDDAEAVAGAFRAFHTLKGAAGIIDFAAMARALHAAEDALSAVRSGARPLDRDLTGRCLSCLDQVVAWLDLIAQSGEPPADAEAAADSLVALFAPDPPPANGPDRPTGQPDPVPAASAVSEAVDALLAAQAALLRGPRDEGFEGRAAAALATAVNVLRAAGEGDAAAELERLAQAGAGVADLVRAMRRASPEADGLPAPAPAAAPSPQQGDPRGESAAADSGARSLRVDIGRVDALVRLAGEFTVLMNAAGHAAALAERGEGRALAPLLKRQHGALERLVDAFQHAVLALRVLPLRHVFQRFPRLVRDMAQALDKPLRLVIEGEATEADKAIVEALFEPLLHILRNAADHAIEPAAARRAAGKPETGLVVLRARREEDRLVVEVEDDGGGLDTARIRAVAAARGVASPEALAALTEEEAGDLVFAPGFSTRPDVTDYSGRGVGMDAVRVAVERLGGRVALRSRPGLGTRVRLDLPVSILKTEVMTVEVGGQVLGLPLDVVVETTRIPRAALARIGAARAFVWRGRTVPLLDLSGVLEAEGSTERSSEALVVVTLVAGAYGGLEVGRFGERMSVMLRPMEGLLAGLPCLGTTLLGDGRVLIVLDLHELQL